MANKYRNRNYGRGGYDRDEYGSRSSERNTGRRSGSNYDRGNYTSGSGGYGGDIGDFSSDRQENYFGSGRQQYGGGFTGTSSERGYGSYDRDFENDYTIGGSRQNQTDRYRTGRGGRNLDRGNYSERGFGTSDYDDDRSSGYGSRNRYGRGGGYQGERLDSMRGYYNDSDDSDYDSYDDRDDRGWVDRATDEVASWFGDEEAERRRRMDAHRQGQHRGRGPKNYRRSDERITEDIHDRLTENSFLDASEIEVEVSGGEVILKGTVDSRYAKRMAEDIIEDIFGVTHVENRIRVNQSLSGQENFYGQGSSATSETANQATGSPQTAGKSNTDASQTGETTSVTGTSGKSRGKTA